jgi:hypothetical protein
LSLATTMALLFAALQRPGISDLITFGKVSFLFILNDVCVSSLSFKVSREPRHCLALLYSNSFDIESTAIAGACESLSFAIMYFASYSSNSWGTCALPFFHSMCWGHVFAFFIESTAIAGARESLSFSINRLAFVPCLYTA